MKQDTPPQLQIKASAACLFCSQMVRMEEHLKECPGLSPDMYDEKPTFFKIKERGNICKTCWCLFDLTDWQRHRKTQACKKYSSLFTQKNLSQKMISKNQVERPLQTEGTVGIKMSSQEQVQLISNGKSHASDLPEVQSMKDMMSIVQSIMSPLMREWLQRHKHVDRNVLVVYLTSAILDFGTNFLSKPVIVPTWKDIQKVNSSINWIAIIQKPENIFNERFIDNKLIKMTPHKQVRVIKVLNKLSNKYRGLVRKRDLPSVTRIPRIRSYVNIKDILFMIKSMLQLRRKQIAHFALDLYLILILGQRYLSDHQRIQVGVLQLLAANKNKQIKDLQLTFQLLIGKTQIAHQVCLNPQLCLLLREFQWCGFHPKTMRLVGRMNEWLGIYGYSLKNAMLNAAAAVSSDLRLSQHIAGHRSLSNTLKYTRETAIGDTLQVTSRLVIPGLSSRFGSYDENQVIEYLNSLVIPNLRYAAFKPNWRQQFLSRLYCTRYENQFNKDVIVDFMQLRAQQMIKPNEVESLQQINEIVQKEQEIVQKEQEIIEKVQVQEQEASILKNESNLEENLNQKDEKVLIYGNVFSFSNYSFNRKDFYQNATSKMEISCLLCQNSIKAAILHQYCVYCCGAYHQNCAPLICICANSSPSLKHPSISSHQIQSKPKISSVRIIMPQQFIRDYTFEEQQIKILINSRHMRYTRLPVLSTESQVSSINYWRDAEWLHLPEYANYITGAYMPPIRVQPIHNYKPHAVFGTQWGIFATDTIPKDSLIGQFAADILRGCDLILCKKMDSIMMMSGKNSPNDLYLAPKDYAGFVLLVNSCNKNKANCIVQRVVVLGALRVLLLASRRINKGQQILYNYGPSYKFN